MLETLNHKMNSNITGGLDFSQDNGQSNFHKIQNSTAIQCFQCLHLQWLIILVIPSQRRLQKKKKKNPSCWQINLPCWGIRITLCSAHHNYIPVRILTLHESNFCEHRLRRKTKEEERSLCRKGARSLDTAIASPGKDGVNVKTRGILENCIWSYTSCSFCHL